MTYNDDDWNDPEDGPHGAQEAIAAAVILGVILLLFVVLGVTR